MFSSPSPFGQSSGFGTPAAFGQSNNNQSNNMFALKPFGVASSPFGGTSTGVFGPTQSSSPFSSITTLGASSSPAFGASSTPSAFSGSSVFGGQTPAFGSTPSQPAFGNTAFGSSSQPAFGASTGVASTAPAFGAPSASSAFGVPSTPAFGAFGASTAPAFGSPSTPAFGTGRPAPAFGAPAFGQSGFTFSCGVPSPSPFGPSSSPFGTPTATFGFGQRGGSRVAAFAATLAESDDAAKPGKLVSISAMPVYKDKSHEELRSEDYQSGDKGGPVAPTQKPGGFITSPCQPSSNIFSPNPLFNGNAFAPSVTSSPSIFNPPITTTPPSPFAPSVPSSPSIFNSPITSTPSPFAPSVISSPSIFNPPITTNPPSPFAPSVPSPPSIFNSPVTSTPSPFAPSVPSSPSIFNPPITTTLSPFATTSIPVSNPSRSQFSFSPGLAPGSAPSFNPGLFPFPSPVTTPTTNGFGITTNAFGPIKTPSFNTQPNLFSTPSTGLTSVFSTAPSLISSTITAPLSQTTTSIFAAPLPVGGCDGIVGNLQNGGAVKAVPASNPFGTLPSMPQVSIGRGATSSPLQYGISSMPVPDKAAPMRISSVLTSRHLSQRRIRLPVRKYNPKTDATKVAFFSYDEETAGVPKEVALFLPRENPRALVIRPAEQWPSKSSADKASTFKDASPVHHNGNGVGEEREANEVHGAGIEALMPKLHRSDYYTEPSIQELAAKERADPGFCRRVPDFVIGRHGFGRIKFPGETDVCGLDLEPVVELNKREVIVYKDDDGKKPPVGQGLNKPAEVSLLNIKCFDKKTGREYTRGPSVERYKEMLKRKTEEQGAEFVSYDPVQGEWKFRVAHFSRH